ncbi:hypothetical protein AVEN_161691-1 [Araneus ventricosus]|uniref:RNase H type-1 domain-containing protein n=1 Tax=Araneus ventricosus TaxID=182803 RepID=A0A4Y2L7B1_ARAVE|nr:hypothetical protein AVEN_161691-1 [Araneus ventricosus]
MSQSVMRKKQRSQYRKHLVGRIDTTQLAIYRRNKTITKVVQSSIRRSHCILHNDACRNDWLKDSGCFLTSLAAILAIMSSENYRDSGAKAIHTDGSKTDEGTGSAYCIRENYEIIASWQGKLDHCNSVFQAENLAVKMAIEAASSLHRPIKILTDSLSSLMAILNPKSHHSMVREIQTLLLSHKQIYLRWPKAHVGYLGNECADQLAKEPITKGDPFFLPKPLSYLKSEIRAVALIIWQDNWDNGETGRSTQDIVPRVSNKPVGWNREEIMFFAGHGPFPSYLHRVNIRTHDNCLCGEIGDPMHYATKCRFTLF